MKITLLNNNDKNKDKIIDLNFSIKDELIYLFYIIENKIENATNYNLKYKIYSQSSMALLKENEIQLENNFIPTKLFGDDKFLYCFSNSNQVLMIKKHYKMKNQLYINCSINLFDKEIKLIKELKNLESFKMYNSLGINNLFILDNEEENKTYMGKFIDKKNNNYILNIYELYNNNKKIENVVLRVSYGDNRFVTIKLVKNKNILGFYMSTKETNNLIDKGVSFLPFDCKYYYNRNDCSNDIYEYLLQQYSSILNLCGNFDLMNIEKEHNIIKNPINLCCNFEQKNLDFVIKNIIENDIYDNIKLYYIIILKQIICSFYNSDIFVEEHLDELISYFKKLIMNNIKEKGNKNFNKILKEIITIISYIKKQL